MGRQHIFIKYLLDTPTANPTFLQSELIRLYINHRPALPLDKHYINTAFSVISDRCDFCC